MSNIFNGVRPSIGQQFTINTNIYAVLAIGGKSIIIGKLINVAIAASHKSLITIRETFQ